MKTDNLSTLKIHKLTQAQYERELAAGRIDENALYLTPDTENPELTEENALKILMEIGAVEPAGTEDGKIYINTDGSVLIL